MTAGRLDAIESLRRIEREFHRRGWSLGSSGNFCMPTALAVRPGNPPAEPVPEHPVVHEFGEIEQGG